MTAASVPPGLGGILLVDKPRGITSHDVVARARRALGTRKVGHAGTLDPMATGLLILGVDSSTRLLTYLVGLPKQYTATIRLGQSSTTDDAEGELSEVTSTHGMTRDAIDAGIAALTGDIEQVPSTFSAIKVDGKRAYELARAGKDVELKSRAVTISRFEVMQETVVTDASGPHSNLHSGLGSKTGSDPVTDLDVVIECTSGTYIRALARDLGAGLGVGGYLTALRRTSIGPFQVTDAVSGDAIVPEARRTSASVAAELFPTIPLDADDLIALTQGKRVRVPASDAAIAAAVAGGSPDGEARLVGLVSVKDGVARVLVNFPTEEVLA